MQSIQARFRIFSEETAELIFRKSMDVFTFGVRCFPFSNVFASLDTSRFSVPPTPFSSTTFVCRRDTG